jgi:hypothetical protein
MAIDGLAGPRMASQGGLRTFADGAKQYICISRSPLKNEGFRENRWSRSALLPNFFAGFGDFSDFAGRFGKRGDHKI